MLPYFTDRAWGYILSAVLLLIVVADHFLGG